MQYINYYSSPLGPILLAADEIGLTGVWFEGQKYFPHHLSKTNMEQKEQYLPVFDNVKRWLDIYFSGKEPAFTVPLHFTGTPFQNDIWNILCSIPYGKTMTYSAIAERLAVHRGIKYMSAQAVGGAVGHNKMSILVPCHRIVGATGSLTGYAGGIERKIELLTLEGVDMDALFVPK